MNFTSGRFALFLLVVAMLSLIGCASNKPFVRLSDGSLDVSQDHGILAFSSIKMEKRDVMWDYVLRSDNEETGLIGREFRLPNGFYDLPCGRVGNFIASELKPGRYKFGPWTLNVDVTMPIGGIYIKSGRSSRGPNDANFFFDIKRGEVTYVGEIIVDKSGEKAVVNDNWDCDMQYFHQTWPSLSNWPVDRNVKPFPVIDAPNN